jgi:hypothetical protein
MIQSEFVRVRFVHSPGLGGSVCLIVFALIARLNRGGFGFRFVFHMPPISHNVLRVARSLFTK